MLSLEHTSQLRVPHLQHISHQQGYACTVATADGCPAYSSAEATEATEADVHQLFVQFF